MGTANWIANPLSPILAAGDFDSQSRNWWVRLEDFGNMLLSALQVYQRAFFEQEEQRVEPIPQGGLEHAQQLAGCTDVPDLISELSQGVRYEEAIGKELILAPTFWMTLLVHLEKINEDQKLFLFGARPSIMSAIPGERCRMAC